MFRCVFSGEERRDVCGSVCGLRVYIYFVGSLGAGFLVSGILNMYGIFLLRLLIMRYDWVLIMG